MKHLLYIALLTGMGFISSCASVDDDDYDDDDDDDSRRTTTTTTTTIERQMVPTVTRETQVLQY